VRGEQWNRLQGVTHGWGGCHRGGLQTQVFGRMGLEKCRQPVLMLRVQGQGEGEGEGEGNRINRCSTLLMESNCLIAQRIKIAGQSVLSARRRFLKFIDPPVYCSTTNTN
jgi:hypothetical protein